MNWQIVKYAQMLQPCIGIADEEGIRASGHRIEHCLRKGVVKKFNQIHEIADYNQIPIHSLKKTIEQFNDYVEQFHESG